MSNFMKNCAAFTSNARRELERPKIIGHFVQKLGGEVVGKELKRRLVLGSDFFKIFEESERNDVDSHLRLFNCFCLELGGRFEASNHIVGFVHLLHTPKIFGEKHTLTI
jgi:hypothetical protein